MATIFNRIISGEIPSYRIAATSTAYAFLDINPVKPGHTLVVPRREVDYFYDLEDDEIADLMSLAKEIAQAIQAATGCLRVGTAIMGLEVPHAHIHLIPLRDLGDMNLYDKYRQTPEELEAMAQAIVALLPEHLR